MGTKVNFEKPGERGLSIIKPGRKREAAEITPATNPDTNSRFKWVSWAAFAVPFLAAGLVYLLTAAAGLTWRHGGDDGGDFATAVALDGVPHPTGYPLFLLTGKLFSFLAPDPARALTLTTLLWGSLAVGVLSLTVYRFNRRLLGRSDTFKTSSFLLEVSSLSGGWLAALSMAFAPLVWSQAIIIEIYSLNLLLLAGLLLALEWWWEKPTSPGRFYLLALVGGLGAGHHRTSIFSLLAVVVFVFLTMREGKIRAFFHWQRLVIAIIILGLVAGLPSLVLLSRGSQNPASNWDNLSWSDPGGFWQYLSGEEYRNLLFAAPIGQSVGRIPATAGLLFQQFGVIGLALGWVGLAVAWLTLAEYRPLAWLITVGMVGHMAFAAVYAADNSQVYLIPFFTFWAVVSGFGLGWLVLAGITRWPQYARWMAGVGLGLVLLVAVVGLVPNYARLDLSRDSSAETWAKTQLGNAPAGSILVSTQDSATFAMWYVQYVQRYRPEIAVVEAGLLDVAWYRGNLEKLYPNLKLPAIGDRNGLEAANPGRKMMIVRAPDQTALP